MPKCLILGGGIIGLSTAWELARRGAEVTLLEAGEPGEGASWAGAGMIPPGTIHAEHAAMERLFKASVELHPEWEASLQAESGIDSEYLRCGALYLPESAGQPDNPSSYCSGPDNEGELLRDQRAWQAINVEAELLTLAEVRRLEPRMPMGWKTGCVDPRLDDPTALLVRSEAQLRNPRRLKSLITACEKRGVRIVTHCAIERLDSHEGRATQFVTSQGNFAADQFLIASGAHSQLVAQLIGFELMVRPIRGQMLLLRTPTPLLRRIVNIGSRYLVPRSDGRLLVGSTEEEVGFVRETTEDSLAELRRMALRLVPDLIEAEVEQGWAGLRPGSADGMPYLGDVPGWNNLFLATGHFRAGITLSPVTAMTMAQRMLGESPTIDLGPFALNRASVSLLN